MLRALRRNKLKYKRYSIKTVTTEQSHVKSVSTTFEWKYILYYSSWIHCYISSWICVY